MIIYNTMFERDDVDDVHSERRSRVGPVDYYYDTKRALLARYNDEYTRTCVFYS